jgi:hypothetical protein
MSLKRLTFETEIKIAHAAEATDATFDEIANETLTVLCEALARQSQPSPSHIAPEACAP